MIHQLLLGTFEGRCPIKPGRSIQVLPPQKHPPKKGFASSEGRARLMHDLASIELQAMELGLRTLVEFPDAPRLFREELAEVAISEAKHLKLCIDQLEMEGYQWGAWPVHTALWDTTSPQDDLLDRIFIVHRYLEGSGLDAGDTLLRRLKGMSETAEQRVMQTIHDEEVDHVAFGSRWFKALAKEQGLDPEEKLKEQIARLRHVLPKRIEKIAIEPRLRAGFSEAELLVFEELRESFLLKTNPNYRRQNQSLVESINS